MAEPTLKLILWYYLDADMDLDAWINSHSNHWYYYKPIILWYQLDEKVDVDIDACSNDAVLVSLYLNRSLKYPV